MKTITIDDACWERIKGQVDDTINAFGEMIGKSFFFRTITYHLVGKVKRFIGEFVVLEEASWVADSGRFTNAIKEGKLNEVEPVGIAYVNMKSVTDFFPWHHGLPTEQK